MSANVYVPTNDPVLDRNGLMTEPWRRYQERIGAAITPGGVNEALTSDGVALIWKLLTNANISAAAAIAWTKISKTGSSLADLTTRSAADLTSGLLSLARGGTAADLSATGGTSRVLRQSSVGAAITVSQLASTDISDVASGVYTPTLTNETNVAASTSFQCQYLRVGSVVTVSGEVAVDPTAAGQVKLGISLPIASNFGSVQDGCGVASAPAVAGQVAGIYADVANDRLTMEWSTVNTTNQGMVFTVTYRVI